MKSRTLIFTLLLFLCVSSFGIAEIAYDNHRQGFIIGGLGGIAANAWKELRNDVTYADGTNIALHIDLRIGGGFKGDKFMLYYWDVMNWLTPIFIAGDTTDFTISGITGIGVSYYFKPTSPSLYINAGTGISMWYRYIDGIIFGPGFMGGIGYEFARHWSVECGVMWGHPIWGYPFEAEYKINSLSISLSIIGIAY